MAAADAFRDDLYEILGLEPGADEKEVARAYRKKSVVHHPDRGGDGALAFFSSRRPRAIDLTLAGSQEVPGADPRTRRAAGSQAEGGL